MPVFNSEQDSEERHFYHLLQSQKFKEDAKCWGALHKTRQFLKEHDEDIKFKILHKGLFKYQ